MARRLAAGFELSRQEWQRAAALPAAALRCLKHLDERRPFSRYSSARLAQFEREARAQPLPRRYTAAQLEAFRARALPDIDRTIAAYEPTPGLDEERLAKLNEERLEALTRQRLTRVVGPAHAPHGVAIIAAIAELAGCSPASLRRWMREVALLSPPKKRLRGVRRQSGRVKATPLRAR
jgi:hypothetical protein